MKGRVVICKEYSKPFEIEEFDVPDPEPGAVMLRMTQAGICGSDLHTWRGDQVNVPLPPTGRVMGHEGTGVVDKLGSGVILLAAAEGDKVSLVAGVTKDLTDRVKAGDLMKHVAGQVGGKGGGRPDMAQGGGSDAAALPAALESAYRWVAEQL